MEWTSNYSQLKLCDVITHMFSNFNNDLGKPPLKLGYGWCDRSMETDVMDERDFTKLEFTMTFRRIFYITSTQGSA